MNQAVATIDPGALMEEVIVKGDLSKLTPNERASYYTAVCKSIGLNPLTKPFEYITLNGKLTLYALRGCTDQLRSIYGVSILEMTETEREGVFIVTVKASNASGRTDMAKGAVNIAGLKGEALANAMMKAETKAKRRATLSLCGLGMLDETEIEDIPSSAKAPAPKDVTPAKAVEAPQDSEEKKAAVAEYNTLRKQLAEAPTPLDVDNIMASSHEFRTNVLPKFSQEAAEQLLRGAEARRAALRGDAP